MHQKNGWSSSSHHTKPPPSQNVQLKLAARWLYCSAAYSTSPKEQRRPLPSLLSLFFFYDIFTTVGEELLVDVPERVLVHSSSRTHLWYEYGICESNLKYLISFKTVICILYLNLKFYFPRPCLDSQFSQLWHLVRK